MGVVGLCLSCTALVGLLPAAHDRAGLLQVAFAERPPSDELEEFEPLPSELLSDTRGSDESLADISTRLADISRLQATPQAEMQRHTKSLEVRVRGFKQRLASAATGSERRERELQRQLELARGQRNEVESYEAAEQHEAVALRAESQAVAEAAEEAVDEEQREHDLLLAAKRELASKSQEVAGTHEALARSLGLAGDLRAAAQKAARQASRARREAEVAKRDAVDERMQARDDLAAANAAISEADEVAEEVSRERRELQMREARAEAEQMAGQKARRMYEERFKKARRAEAIAKQQREESLVAEQQFASEERMALQQQQRQAALALESARREESQHFKAAAAMRQSTEEAEALVEQAGREKLAAKRERERARSLIANTDRMNTNMVSFVSWAFLVLILIGALGFSMEIHKLEAAGLRPVELLRLLRSCSCTSFPKKSLAAHGADAPPPVSSDSAAPMPPVEKSPEADSLHFKDRPS